MSIKITDNKRVYRKRVKVEIYFLNGNVTAWIIDVEDSDPLFVPLKLDSLDFKITALIEVKREILKGCSLLNQHCQATTPTRQPVRPRYLIAFNFQLVAWFEMCLT